MCQNSWCRLQFLKTRISNAFSSTGTSIETMILLITLYIIDILGSGYFPKRKGYLSKSHAMIMYSKTSQRLDMEHCCGVLLKQLTHVNQSVMLETNTFPTWLRQTLFQWKSVRKETAVIVSFGEYSARNSESPISVLAPSTAPVSIRISGANTGMSWLSSMSRLKKSSRCQQSAMWPSNSWSMSGYVVNNGFHRKSFRNTTSASPAPSHDNTPIAWLQKCWKVLSRETT